MAIKRRPPMTPRDLAILWARRGTTEEKFWARFERGPDCWRWLGAHNSGGYGLLKTTDRLRSAHRVSWELHNGPIPEGLWVCHHCDVRDCVRPDHLFLGTARDNVADMIAKGRRGHTVNRTAGEAHYAARLSDIEVAQIRVAVADGEMHRIVAARYGVTRQYVGMLVSGRHRV